jgi:hypothetical protein
LSDAAVSVAPPRRGDFREAVFFFFFPFSVFFVFFFPFAFFDEVFGIGEIEARAPSSPAAGGAATIEKSHVGMNDFPGCSFAPSVYLQVTKRRDI